MISEISRERETTQTLDLYYLEGTKDWIFSLVPILLNHTLTDEHLTAAMDVR